MRKAASDHIVLEELPGDLLDRCMRPLGLWHLVMCEQVCPELREASLRIQQNSIGALSFMDLISDDEHAAIGRLTHLEHAGSTFASATSKKEACAKALQRLPRLLSGQRFLGLSKLNLSGSDWYSNWRFQLDDGAAARMPSCPQLEVLELRGCGVTDRGLSHLAKACPGLRLFDFTYCNRATYQAVIDIRTYCPAIQVPLL